MRELKGRNVLITGASRGIGERIARAFASAGANVALVARDADALGRLAAELSQGAVRSVALPADVADFDAHERLLDRAEAELGPLDVLVNNAALDGHSVFAEFPAQRIEQLLRINLTAPMLLTRALLPRLIARRRGHIVNISSLSGKSATPFDTTYSASKGGLVLFSQSLRGELRESGVGVSVICPGFVSDVGMYADVSRQHGVKASRVVGESSPDAVARAVLRAVRRDIAEILVNPGPIRLMQALNQLSPELFLAVTTRLGVPRLFQRVALAQRGSESSSSR